MFACCDHFGGRQAKGEHEAKASGEHEQSEHQMSTKQRLGN
jgi:hypothetical protein